MKCPNCSSKVISFLDWCGGINAFRYQCPHCGCSLRANARSIVACCIGFLIVVAEVWGGGLLLKQWGVSSGSVQKLIIIAIMMLTIGPVAYWVWKTGCYAPVKSKEI